MQGPLPQRRGIPDLSTARPVVSSDSTAISRLKSTEPGEVCTDATFAYNRQHDENPSPRALGNGKGSGSGGASASLTKRRGISSSGRAAHRFKPLINDDDWQLRAARSPVTPLAATQHVQHSDVVRSLSEALPIASKVAAARESLLRHPANCFS